MENISFENVDLHKINHQTGLEDWFNFDRGTNKKEKQTSMSDFA